MFSRPHLPLLAGLLLLAALPGCGSTGPEGPAIRDNWIWSVDPMRATP